MRTKTIYLYRFDELSKEAKDKAIEYFREQEEFYFLEDDMKNELDNILDDNEDIKAIGETKVYYSLSYSQGDGVMFEGQFKMSKYPNLIFEVKHSGHYYHEYSKTTEIIEDFDEGEPMSTNEYRKADLEFEKWYLETCINLKKYGYEVIEYEQSDEAITEFIEVNEYEFLEDGTIA
jgi:hypothetical protein